MNKCTKFLVVSMFLMQCGGLSANASNLDWNVIDSGFQASGAVSTAAEVKIRFANFDDSLRGSLEVSIADGKGNQLKDDKGNSLRWAYMGKGQIESFTMPSSERLIVRVGTEVIPNHFAKEPIFVGWQSQDCCVKQDYSELTFRANSTTTTSAKLAVNGKIKLASAAPQPLDVATVKLDIKIKEPTF